MQEPDSIATALLAALTEFQPTQFQLYGIFDDGVKLKITAAINGAPALWADGFSAPRAQCLQQPGATGDRNPLDSSRSPATLAARSSSAPRPAGSCSTSRFRRRGDHGVLQRKRCRYPRTPSSRPHREPNGDGQDLVRRRGKGHKDRARNGRALQREDRARSAVFLRFYTLTFAAPTTPPTESITVRERSTEYSVVTFRIDPPDSTRRNTGARPGLARKISRSLLIMSCVGLCGTTMERPVDTCEAVGRRS